MAPYARRAVADACRYFDRWLAYRRRTERVPGVQVAVLHDGEVVHSGAHGVADETTGEPLTTAHRFRIASHSKMFTAVAALQLVEQGRLRLDDAASQWVPFLAGGPLAAVTVRELLSHAGGVVRDGVEHGFWQLAEPFPDVEGLARIAAGDGAAVFGRNERLKYSNIGFGLAGLVVEAAGGAPYGHQVAERILGPLGLAATTVDLDADADADSGPGPTGTGAAIATAHSALSYADRRVPIAQVDSGALAPATGFVSTCEDVVRFVAALLPGDGRLLGDDTKRQMQRVEWTGESYDGSYGLGIMVNDVGGRRVLGHGGGWPGHISRTMADPDGRLVVSVCTNAIDGPATPYAMTLLALVELAQRGVDAGVPAEAATVDAASFGGRFADLWGVFDLVDLGGRLYRIPPGLPLSVGDTHPLEIVDASTLRIARTSAYGAPGERLGIERDGIGEVVAVTGSGGTSYPIDTVVRRLAELGRVRPGDRLGS